MSISLPLAGPKASSVRGILQEELPSGKVRCNVCAFRCELSEGQVGMCRVRRNDSGEIRYFGYEHMSHVCEHVDTCGAGSYCVGAMGCNWSCSFCINTWTTNPEFEMLQNDIASTPLTKDGYLDKKALIPNRSKALVEVDGFSLEDDWQVTPEDVVGHWEDSGKEWLAVRGSEPSIHAEASFEMFRGARDKGGKVLINTNGYWTPELVEYLAPVLDVVHVGLKGSANEMFLRKVCGVPNRQPIFDTIEALQDKGCWMLVSDIPVHHDSWQDDFRKVCEFVASTIPARDFPRLKLFPWQGSMPSVAFGNFSPGIPDGSNFDRAGLLYEAIDIAGEYLESVLLYGVVGNVLGSTRVEDFVAGLRYDNDQQGTAYVVDLRSPREAA